MKIASINADVLGLKVWYDDGSVYRIPFYELDEGWKALPDFGVQVVAIYDRGTKQGKHYAQWFASYDYYVLSPTVGIVETNRSNEIPDDGIVKQGSEMDKDKFREMYNAAMRTDF